MRRQGRLAAVEEYAEGGDHPSPLNEWQRGWVLTDLLREWEWD